MNCTDEQLKRAAAKMLPEKLETYSEGDTDLVYLVWKKGKQEILDTEMLAVCQMIEDGLDAYTHHQFRDVLREITASPFPFKWGEGANRAYCTPRWQQRITALAKVLNVEVV